MSGRLNLAVTACVALVLASIGTHITVKALGIPTKLAMGHKRFGRVGGSATGLISGSSLTYDGLDWNKIAASVGVTIESWPVPGSSPAEWEPLQRRSPQAKTTFVGVSLYDLNENGSVISAPRSCRSGRQSRTSGLADRTAFASALSSYPRGWVRTVFPAAGRSDRVIFGLRDAAISLVGGNGGESGGETKLKLAADYTSDDRLSDWPRDRLLRKLASMRSLQGKAGFSGPKHLAFLRLLRQPRRQGQ